MGTRKRESVAGKVLVSALLACIVLAGGSFFFFRYAMPVWDIDPTTVYTVALRLFPILIGLVMLLMGIVISLPTNDEGAGDESDAIKQTPATQPLDRLPDGKTTIYPAEPESLYDRVSDDEILIEGASGLATAKVSATVIQPFRAPEPTTWPFTFAEAPPEQSFELPRETVADEMLSQPSSVEAQTWQMPVAIQEEPVGQQEQEQPWHIPAEIRDESVSTDSGACRAVEFTDYPYEVVPGTMAAELLEPLPATELQYDERVASYEVSIEDGLEARLDEELASAHSHAYDLSVGILTIGSSADVEQERRIAAILVNQLGNASFPYPMEDNRIAFLFPFQGFQRTKRVLAAAFDTVRKQVLDANASVGFSSLSGRTIERKTLLDEAGLAAALAAEQGGFSIIGFETETE